jgi:hypothetical protein
MADHIKSGKDVIEEFIAEIYNIEGIDEDTVDAIVLLYEQGKLSDKNIQNAIDQVLQEQLNPKKE